MVKDWSEDLCKAFLAKPQLPHPHGSAASIQTFSGACNLLQCALWPCCGYAQTGWATWGHDHRCPVLLLGQAGSLLGQSGLAPMLWRDTLDEVGSPDIFAGYGPSTQAFTGCFGVIFVQQSKRRSLKPREKEGSWGNTGSSASLILYFHCCLCICAHYLHKCMVVHKLYIVFSSKLAYSGWGVFRKTRWLRKSSNMLS